MPKRKNDREPWTKLDTKVLTCKFCKVQDVAVRMIKDPYRAAIYEDEREYPICPGCACERHEQI